MGIQQKYIKKVLALILFISINSFFYSQNTSNKIVVKKEIRIIDKHTLSIRVYNPNVSNTAFIFSFYNNIPSYLEVAGFKYIYNMKIYKKDNSYLAIAKPEIINLSNNFFFIEYYIKLPEIDNKSFLPISSYIIDGKYAIFNNSTILGYFKGIDYLVNLEIVQNDKPILNIQKDNNLLKDSRITFGFKNIMQGKSNFPLSVKVNNNNILNNKILEEYITESISTIINIESFDRKIKKEMIFIFDSVSENTGAIAHNNTIVFHFNTNDRFIIQKTIIHELFHWIVPDQNSWLNEGFAEYMALKKMTEFAFICERDFFEKMTRKLQLAEKYKDLSLSEIYENTKYYSALYTKGAFYAWIADLIVMKNTNYKHGLLKYILNPTAIHKDDRDRINIELANFESEYILKNKYFSYNKYLNDVGLIFEQNKLREIKPKQTLIFEQCNTRLVIKDNAIVDELLISDEIISVDGANEIEEINEKLFSMSEKSSNFVIMRNGKKMKLKIDNKNSVMRKLRYYIGFLENADALQKRNWQYFLQN